MNKKYLNINEVSKIVGLKEHTIRYWDSVDPKTNRLRITGLSTKTKGGTRYFNNDNLNKLQNLKNLIYGDGNFNTPSKLVEKLLSSKKTITSVKDENSINKNSSNPKNYQKIDQILKKMRFLLK